MMKDSERVFIWYLMLPMVMQAIPGEIKALVILISNEMPGENTDQNTTQAPYWLASFSFHKTLLFTNFKK